MNKIKFSKLLSFVALFFLLIACKDDNSNSCKAVENPDGCACPEILDPICGCDGITYENSCYAECDGITNYTQGACE